MDGNSFKNGTFRNDNITVIFWFPWPSFPQTQSKMTGDCKVSKFLRRSVDGKHLMRFSEWNFSGLVWTWASINRLILTVDIWNPFLVWCETISFFYFRSWITSTLTTIEPFCNAILSPWKNGIRVNRFFSTLEMKEISLGLLITQ